jgi:hypothetical protein
MSFRRILCRCSYSLLPITLALPLLRAQPAAQSSSPTSSSSKSSKPASKPAAGASPALDSGAVHGGVYHNPGLGFSCKIPAGWVLRTDEMNAEDDDIESTGDAKPAAGAGKDGRVLLAAFSRPPQARGEDVNSSILIVAESVSLYPGLKDAAQYFGPVGEIAKAQGFEVVEEPYEFSLGTKLATKTVVRGDFQKNVGQRVMRQSTLVDLARGYALSFTFIGGSEDEVEQLLQGLSFAAGMKIVK